METILFGVTLAIPVLVTFIAIVYLRPILLTILVDLCGTRARAEFWIRCATLLSLSGGLILVLVFGPSYDTTNILDALRRILLWALAGSFVGIAWISVAVWTSITRRESVTVTAAKEIPAPDMATVPR